MIEYKIEYEDWAIFTLSLLIEYLKLEHRRRFSNSWLEDILITPERDLEIDKFFDELFDFIDYKLSTWMIWVIQEKWKDYYMKKIILDVRSYSLTLFCKQYLKEKIIVVEDIKIN
jgi:hypothetical protein